MEHAFDTSKGFNLIELVIVIAVVAILASIAIPSYFNYTRRTYYGDILQTLTPYKNAIASCADKNKKFKACNGGTHKIPANILQPKGSIASLKVIDGVITVVPVAYDGVTTEDVYILTPSRVGQTVTWIPSGPAVSKGYVD
jgi:prepilin peptidase dependent protein D